MVRSGVEVPFQSWAYDVWKTHKDSNSKDDPEARCLPPGVPRMSTTPYPWTFVQTPNMLVIVYEGGAHIWRKVFMDGRGHDPNVVETWLGDSIGHWEGDTLVVETVGQNDKTWIDEAGIPHSSDMKVIEKISRPDLAHLTIAHHRRSEDVHQALDFHDAPDAAQRRVDRVYLPREQPGRGAFVLQIARLRGLTAICYCINFTLGGIRRSWGREPFGPI
jgi:hypothetical protein